MRWILLFMIIVIPAPARSADLVADTLARIETILKQAPTLSVAQRQEIIPLIALSINSAIKKHSEEDRERYRGYSALVAEWSVFKAEQKKNKTGGLISPLNLSQD